MESEETMEITWKTAKETFEVLNDRAETVDITKGTKYRVLGIEQESGFGAGYIIRIKGNEEYHILLDDDLGS